MTDIEKKVIECCADAYGVGADTITLATDIREEISNQSMRMIAFLSGIEDALDVVIEIREAGNLKTVQEFADRVAELLA